jgi:hypothetical protein
MRHEEDKTGEAATPAVVRGRWRRGILAEHLDEDLDAALVRTAVLQQCALAQPYLLEQPARGGYSLRGTKG